MNNSSLSGGINKLIPSISLFEFPPNFGEASNNKTFSEFSDNLLASYAAVNPDNPAPAIIKS